MSSLDLVFAPDPILKKTAEKIINIDKITIKLIHDMYDTMYKYNGVGLAAPQVNYSLQILVIDCSNKDEKNQPKVLINPRIKSFSKDIKLYEEGCLSFPGHYIEISRPDIVEVNYIDINGKERIEKFKGFESVCIQHEIDHLSGTLFVEYISRLKRQMVLKKMQKYKKKVEIINEK
tara:strand:- start:8986 stop:9513 length:528 start_codon:yes stop_codon:yes gene_type:complete